MDARINDILDNFNFKQCRKAMVALNWTWQGAKNSPSISQLKDAAKELLESVSTSSSDEVEISSGGFRAKKYEDAEAGEVLELVFELTSFESPLRF